jgi:DNA replication protein DnaC
LSISDVYARYERIREKNSIEEQRRQSEVAEKVPGFKKLQLEIKELQKKRILEVFTDGKGYDDKISALLETAEDLLVSGGFSPDYLKPVFTCPLCRDTGVAKNGERCSCFKKRVLEDKLSEAQLLDTNVSFEQFDLSIFSDEPIENGKSQKFMMKKAKHLAEKYADDFPNCSSILLISGGIGLGKTYISKCIMRRVIERGYTAAYYTAYRLFSLFHRHRLGENVDLDPIMEVPLLIIDDIGTEPMTKNVTVEYFFDLLNERSGLHTIIISNLPFDEIFARYGERIHSRLMDKNTSIKVLLKGKDIRYQGKS